MRFQTDNLFATERVGNLLYYALNTRHPLFNELKSIVSKTLGVEGALRRMVRSCNGIRYAFLYGSFASGSEKATSDIDLMIIGTPDISELNDGIARLEKRLQRLEISTTIYSIAEYRAKKRGGAGFVAEVLRAPKIMLIGEENEL